MFLKNIFLFFENKTQRRTKKTSIKTRVLCYTHHGKQLDENTPFSVMRLYKLFFYICFFCKEKNTNIQTNFFMKKLFPLIAVVAIILSIVSFFYSQNSSKQVYVDVNKLLEGYKRTKIVRGEFEAKAKTLKSNVDSLVTDWQKELKIYEKERSKMSKKELALKQELLSNKQQQINNYQQAIQKQIQEEDKKATQTVINDINDYVKEYGEKKGYKIIFGASGSGNIMYADKATDLTQEVLKGLNSEFEGK